VQGLLAARIAHDHIAQNQLRAQALPGSVDAVDDDGIADCLAGQALDIALVVVDIRQNDPAQGQEQDGKGKIQQQRQLDGEAEDMVGGQVPEAIGGLQAMPTLLERGLDCLDLLHQVVLQYAQARPLSIQHFTAPPR